MTSRTLLAVLTLTCPACATTELHGGWVGLDDVVSTGLPDQDAAFDVVATRLAGRYGIADLSGTSPTVTWVSGRRCDGGDVTYVALIHDGQCYAGVTWGLDDVNVVWASRGYDPYADTAFVHELVHALLQGSGLDPDRGHTGPVWREVAPTMDALAATGLGAGRFDWYPQDWEGQR